VWSVELQLTFRRNISPPSSGSKKYFQLEPASKQVASRAVFPNFISHEILSHSKNFNGAPNKILTYEAKKKDSKQVRIIINKKFWK
jgi:hypothetical protein